ncbi:coiled-coil domain-containing protein 87 [Anolis carolinensis]|uniref:coiled-coil domain-containing protein 87 n=1 Tax=Anolis carolinensis TaxID=28377 RepID=UPI002F2B59E0
MSRRVYAAAHLRYPLEDTEAVAQRLHAQYRRLLDPLSLFPTTHSRVQASLPAEAEPDVSFAAPLGPALASPSSPRRTPVPISQAALLQLVRNKMELGPHWAKHIPAVHQRTFREVILTEVRHAYVEVQRSLYNPAFEAHTNRELYQHLVTYVGLVSQHLFLHYLCLMEQHRSLNVFTDCANLTRFSAQLALDCTRFLDIEVVRHHLVVEMKAPRGYRALSLRKTTLIGEHPARAIGCRLGFTIGHFIRLTRPRTQALRQKRAQDIKELEEIPPLDLSIIKQMQLPGMEGNIRATSCAAITMPCPARDKSKPEAEKKARLFRSYSMPNMRAGRLLADELGICITPRRLTPDLPFHYVDDEERMEAVSLADDLRRLVQGSILRSGQWKEEEEDGLDLPPLLKVLTRRKANEARLEHLQRTLASLRYEESSELKRRNTIIAAPASHPQATTVNFKVHEQMVVKAADLQVSERVYSEAVVLERSSLIYNHLLGEINNATLQSLDASLFVGEEVRGMYKELMNTVPKDHLKFDLGPLIESHATKLDFSACFASSTLRKKESEQVVNEELAKILPAGPFSPEEVVDTLKTPNLPIKKPMSKKQHATWLKWWKNTFNIDDYLNYIATKESDFLPVIFHLYSIGGDKEEELQQQAIHEAEVKQEEKVRRISIKKAAKVQFKEESVETGQWKADNTAKMELGVLVPYDHKPEDLRALQRRLERLWTVLHFSESERLDMAIKYSSNQYYFFLPDMLKAWEEAAQLIQERELLLAELESFEQTASDPNRLFSQEPRAFAVRMKESRKRDRLHTELAWFNSELYEVLTEIKKEFNDTVTFRGRPYMEKMQWDKVEMLYWLQQQRRGGALKRYARTGSQRRLPPLT